MPSVYEIVRDAIVNKRIVFATYHGYERIMCPNVLVNEATVASRASLLSICGIQQERTLAGWFT